MKAVLVAVKDALVSEKARKLETALLVIVLDAIGRALGLI